MTNLTYQSRECTSAVVPKSYSSCPVLWNWGLRETLRLMVEGVRCCMNTYIHFLQINKLLSIYRVWIKSPPTNRLFSEKRSFFACFYHQRRYFQKMSYLKKTWLCYTPFSRCLCRIFIAQITTKPRGGQFMLNIRVTLTGCILDPVGVLTS